MVFVAVAVVLAVNIDMAMIGFGVTIHGPHPQSCKGLLKSVQLTQPQLSICSEI